MCTQYNKTGTCDLHQQNLYFRLCYYFHHNQQKVNPFNTKFEYRFHGIQNKLICEGKVMSNSVCMQYVCVSVSVMYNLNHNMYSQSEIYRIH